MAFESARRGHEERIECSSPVIPEAWVARRLEAIRHRVSNDGREGKLDQPEFPSRQQSRGLEHRKTFKDKVSSNSHLTEGHWRKWEEDRGQLAF